MPAVFLQAKCAPQKLASRQGLLELPGRFPICQGAGRPHSKKRCDVQTQSVDLNELDDIISTLQRGFAINWPQARLHWESNPITNADKFEKLLSVSSSALEHLPLTNLRYLISVGKESLVVRIIYHYRAMREDLRSNDNPYWLGVWRLYRKQAVGAHGRFIGSAGPVFHIAAAAHAALSEDELPRKLDMHLWASEQYAQRGVADPQKFTAAVSNELADLFRDWNPSLCEPFRRIFNNMFAGLLSGFVGEVHFGFLLSMALCKVSARLCVGLADLRPVVSSAQEVA